MHKTINLTLMLAALAFVGCKNSNNTISNQSNPSQIDTLISDNDTSYFNNSEDSFTIKVLQVGTFHSDEVWNEAENTKWHGLFFNSKGFYLQETKVKTKRVHDEIVDENETQKTGWEVETLNKDSSIILIESFNQLTNRKIEQARLSKTEILPDDTLHVNYLGNNYMLFATGEKKKAQNNPEWIDIVNYKLFITTTLNGRELKTLLVAQPNFNDKMINLIFAGDIDGDNILDLIIDTSRHYNVSNPTIFLSSKAKNKQVVTPVGGHESTGC